MKRNLKMRRGALMHLRNMQKELEENLHPRKEIPEYK